MAASRKRTITWLCVCVWGGGEGGVGKLNYVGNQLSGHQREKHRENKMSSEKDNLQRENKYRIPPRNSSSAVSVTPPPPEKTP